MTARKWHLLSFHSHQQSLPCRTGPYNWNLQLRALSLDDMQEPLTAESTTGQQADSLQAAVVAVQNCMRHYDGSLVQFRCDEKGFLCICAFGLPGRSHEDSPCRGIQAALSIRSSVKKLHQVRCIPDGKPWNSQYVLAQDCELILRKV